MDLLKDILVPVDFGAPSLRACDRALALARDLRAQVTLLHVIDAPDYVLLPNDPRKLRFSAERTLGALANRLRASGVEIETRIEQGSPWRVTLAAIEAKKPDLVVCGTHNRRGVAYLALGSVAERIVRASSVPVLTVPGFAFESREEAGARLMMELPRHDLPGAISVVALGIDAVPVADVLARRLGTTLDVWDYVPIEVGGAVVGAFGEDDLAWYDRIPAGEPALRAAAEADAKATLREELDYVRGPRAIGDVLDRLIVLVADHLEGAAPVRAAVRGLTPFGVAGIVLVTPIATAASLEEARTLVDGVVCLEQTRAANPAAIAYRASSRPSYRKVRRLLSAWRETDAAASSPTRHAS
jgi:nucleotide-binding universal stress UspA family protein/predicted phosphoribosyltransferase